VSCERESLLVCVDDAAYDGADAGAKATCVGVMCRMFVCVCACVCLFVRVFVHGCVCIYIFMCESECD